MFGIVAIIESYKRRLIYKFSRESKPNKLFIRIAVFEKNQIRNFCIILNIFKFHQANFYDKSTLSSR